MAPCTAKSRAHKHRSSPCDAHRDQRCCSTPLCCVPCASAASDGVNEHSARVRLELRRLCEKRQLCLIKPASQKASILVVQHHQSHQPIVWAARPCAGSSIKLGYAQGPCARMPVTQHHYTGATGRSDTQIPSQVCLPLATAGGSGVNDATLTVQACSSRTCCNITVKQAH